MKVLVGAFNQEIDCEIFGNIRITFVSSTTAVTATKGQEMNDPGYKEEAGEWRQGSGYVTQQLEHRHLASSI